jgi:hypothetical protein
MTLKNSAYEPGGRFCHLESRMIASLVICLIAAVSRAAEPPAPPLSYDQVVSQYMAGDWDDLDAKQIAKQSATLGEPQKADLDYIAKTLTECHPAWWKQCEAGKRTPIKVSIFNVPVSAVYDPKQKDGMSANFNGDSKTFTLGWSAADMNNPQQAEHGFTKGEIGAGSVWSALGMSSGYVDVPLDTLTNPTESSKLKLMRVLSFRGDLAAAYYGNPRTRQWWYFLALHYYRGEYQKSPIVMSRKALGAMLVAELATHPDLYPSIKLPTNLKEENAEESLVIAVHNHIERKGWTLAEDKLIREATKSFALSNASAVHTGGPVKLANGLLISFDPKEDATLHAKRDQWLSQQLSRN